MKSTMLLFAFSLRRVRILLGAAALLLAAFQMVLVLVGASVQRSNAFGQIAALLPPFARELMGPALATMMSFAGVVCVGYFHIAVLGALTALAIALGTMTASEVESGFMDVVLSRPVARHRVVTRSIVLLSAATAVLIGSMLLGTWVGLTWFAPAGAAWPAPAVLRRLSLNLAVLTLSWGAIGMAIGAGARRRSAAGGIAGLLAVAMFLLDYVGMAWKAARPAAWISPFRYYRPFDLLIGKPLPEQSLMVLAGIIAAGFIASYLLFSRRDITH